MRQAFFLTFQLLFISGLVLVIGIQRTVAFFFQRHKVKASSLFLGGVIVVLIGWPLLGIVAEIWGFFLLFGQVFSFTSFPLNFLKKSRHCFMNIATICVNLYKISYVQVLFFNFPISGMDSCSL